MDKKVIVAMPVQIAFEGKTLVVCFMEIDMKEMLSGVSMTAEGNGATFCNIYTSEGVPLSDTVLGGLAVEDNLLEAMQRAKFEAGFSYGKMQGDFAEGRSGEVCFTYGDIRETLSYVPVEGTNWLLTYLIRESVISDNISYISDGILRRSVAQSILTVAALTLDLEKLDYISSAGLRVLLAAHKAMSRKGGMKVKNVNEIVGEVFEVTGFADILTIE